MNRDFEEFKDEVIAEIRANIHKYPSVCKMLLGKVDRLEAEVNALRSTPPPRTYEQGAEAMKSRVLELVERRFRVIMGEGMAGAIRALPTQPEGEGE